MEELAARVFQARDVAHREHWRTKSYSAHMALGSFYDSVIDAVDTLVEAYQGEFGLIPAFSVTALAVPDVIAYLKNELSWLQDNRTKLCKGSTSIQNLYDGVMETYQSTIYKLVNLK